MGRIVDNRPINVQLNVNIGGTQNVVNTNAADGNRALNLVNSFLSGFERGASFNRGDVACGCIPAPNMNQAGAPAGRGLEVNDDGSVTTAGGYKIHATGSQSEWKI